MTAALCVLCGSALNESNNTKEHIIPNAIGGRRKVSGFICINCNSETGETWDAALAKQLAYLSLIFQITRQRNEVVPQEIKTTGGDTYILHSDGHFSPPNKPTINIEEGATTVKMSIKTQSIRQARQVIEGLKRKYPKIDVDTLIATAEQDISYMDEAINFSLNYGGEAECRSLVKSALAVVYDAGIDTGECTHAIAYLRRESSSEACLGFYYERDLLLNRPPHTPLHVVAVDANPETGLIIAYLEYFGAMRYVMCLGENYHGEQRRHQYAIDPITGQQLDIDVQSDLTIGEIRAAYDYQKIPQGSMERALEAVLPTALQQSQTSELSRLIDSAFKDAESRFGILPGDVMTTDRAAKMSALVMEKLTPFLMHNIQKSRRSALKASPNIDEDEANH